MIVVTIGTNEQPFDRLIRAARTLDSDELLVQYGSSREPHGRGEWVEFLSFDELAERARSARAFVCHAGVGSIMLARRCGHRPIVMPRRHHLGEAVDDHQVFLAKRLAKSGIVTLVEDEAQLAAALAAPPSAAAARAGTNSGAGALTADLRTLLSDLGAARAA
ncbi:MAG TPA: glycosyltransferase [Solirubrobacteraceae bacterium]|nr:glycosyltransferase [Solirubrobacteraceae bacterium]